MAKFENGRVYFENFKILEDGLDLYIKEIEYVISTGITDSLFICDDVYFGNNLENEFCNLFITISEDNNTNVQALIEKIWFDIIMKEIRYTDILYLGIWKEQTRLIDKINKEIIEFEVVEYDEQIYYKLAVSDKVLDFIKNNNFTELNRLLWFDFTLHSHDMSIKLNLTHAGKDISLCNITKHKVDSILKLLDGNFVQISIMPVSK